jgi:hypothetical protein
MRRPDGHALQQSTDKFLRYLVLVELALATGLRRQKAANNIKIPLAFSLPGLFYFCLLHPIFFRKS